VLPLLLQLVPRGLSNDREPRRSEARDQSGRPDLNRAMTMSMPPAPSRSSPLSLSRHGWDTSDDASGTNAVPLELGKASRVRGRARYVWRGHARIVETAFEALPG
jgi:hypothetical protein